MRFRFATMASNEGSDEPAHLRSLVKAFVAHTHNVGKYMKVEAKDLNRTSLDKCTCAYEDCFCLYVKYDYHTAWPNKGRK